jgi:hypothetical protein
MHPGLTLTTTWWLWIADFVRHLSIPRDGLNSHHVMSPKIALQLTSNQAKHHGSGLYMKTDPSGRTLMTEFFWQTGFHSSYISGIIDGSERNSVSGGAHHGF